MEVKVNNKKEILKSFIGWLPLALGATVFYGMLFIFIIKRLLTEFIDISQELAGEVGLLFGVVVLVTCLYLYLNWITKSLSSYRLAIRGEILLVKGISGWKTLDKEVPINSIQKIYIGANASTVEKLSSGHNAVSEQVASRLVFFTREGKSFKLDFAAKAFDNKSLFDFLVTIKRNGIDTNVGV